MEIEDLKPNKPNFGLVVALFAGTILVVIVVAVALVFWRGKSVTKVPFTKHPLSLLSAPDRVPAMLG